MRHQGPKSMNRLQIIVLGVSAIAFGGANWEEAMGVALQREFPFVDLAFSGEADESFPAVIEARRRGGAVHGIPGVTTSGGNGLAQA